MNATPYSALLYRYPDRIAQRIETQATGVKCSAANSNTDGFSANLIQPILPSPNLLSGRQAPNADQFPDRLARRTAHDREWPSANGCHAASSSH
jgi:hypothetical protein